jgi:hypothetical protein
MLVQINKLTYIKLGKLNNLSEQSELARTKKKGLTFETLTRDLVLIA